MALIFVVSPLMHASPTTAPLEVSPENFNRKAAKMLDSCVRGSVLCINPAPLRKASGTASNNLSDKFV